MRSFNRILRLVPFLLVAPSVASAGLVTSSWAPVGNQAGASFGASVAAAGDVNHDGYSDVLVGAPKFDNGQADEGRVYLYLGSKNGLAANPAWTWEPDQAGAQAGTVVAAAGDVNNDQFDDIIVGAPFFDRPGHVDAGAVFVFYGSATIPASAPDLTLADDVTGSHFGAAAATAGDVNGDFIPEIVVGAPGFANGQANEGAAYLYLGAQGALSTVPSFTLEGNEVDARLGAAVSGAGDVNGDAFADVILGAPGASPGGVIAAGKALIYRGSASGLGVLPVITIAGPADSSAAGGGVSLAGDVDADGYGDIVVGLPGDHGAGVRRGRIRVYRGQASGIDPSTYFEGSGLGDQSRVGTAVATAGDLDGDGYAEVVVGNQRASYLGAEVGFATAYYGNRGGFGAATFLTGTQAFARFGAAVASAGDFDGDGLGELLVGVPDYGTPGLLFEGQVMAFLGRPSGPVGVPNSPVLNFEPSQRFGEAVAIVPRIDTYTYPSLLISQPDWDLPITDAGRVLAQHAEWGNLGYQRAYIYEGGVNDGNFGSVVADAGDVHADGNSDFLIGSPLYSMGGLAQRGRVVLYKGGENNGNGPQPEPWLALGDQADAQFGSSIAARGDVNGDGYADAVIGARNWADGANTRAGKAWLYLGGPAGFGASSWSAQGVAASQYFGYAMAMLDFDADGYSDVAIASQPSTPNLSPPRVDLYYGGPTGLAAQPAFTLSPFPAEPTYGTSVASLGDFDGDGVGDLAVGASDGGGGAGIVYFYRGSMARSNPNNLARRYVGSGTVAGAGYAIGGGGDINGDGRADFVVGAPFSSNGESSEGRLLVFYGKNGIAPLLFPDTTFESNLVNGRIGSALSPLGDLNADGYADIAAGGMGNTWVYLGGGEGPYQGFATVETHTGGFYRTAPALLQSQHEVGARMNMHSPAGRARLRLQFEIQRQDVPFTGDPNYVDEPFVNVDSGPPSALGSTGSIGTWVAGLWPNVTYHWRARMTSVSPFFPRSRWFTPDGRADGQYDFRTAFVPVAVPGGAEGVPRLGSVSPNPATGTVSIAFSLPGRADLRLDVYDVRGRHVRTLARESAGSGTRAWDGADDQGRRVRPGLYFVEMRAGDVVERARIVRLD